MTTTKEEAKLVNGVRVDELFAAMDAMKKTPAMGKTQVRIANNMD